MTGEHKEWQHAGDTGSLTRFRFCPECGSTLTFVNQGSPETIAVAIRAFADPEFPSPSVSIFEERKHSWVAITGEVEHD